MTICIIERQYLPNKIHNFISLLNQFEQKKNKQEIIFQKNVAFVSLVFLFLFG